MNLSKSLEYFNPTTINGAIHIIGCGSVGSTIAENLARCGVRSMVLWDFDRVEEHNIVNQMFTKADVGKEKTEALKGILQSINPDIEIKTKKGWQGETLAGYIFLCVDSIEIRREICEKHMLNPMVKAVFDIRTLLEHAQHYAADWSSKEMRENLLATMQFSHEEAKAETPTSACGITLGVCPVVRVVSSIAVTNFIHFIKGEGIKKMVLVDLKSFEIDAF